MRLGETGHSLSHRPHLGYQALLLDRKEEQSWILTPSKRTNGGKPKRDDEPHPQWRERDLPSAPSPLCLCYQQLSEGLCGLQGHR